MSTKKVIGGSVAAIVILIIAQLAAQLAASALNLIKIPDGICNIIAGIFLCRTDLCYFKDIY